MPIGTGDGGRIEPQGPAFENTGPPGGMTTHQSPEPGYEHREREGLAQEVVEPFEIPLIHTVRGVGYVLRVPEEASS